MLSLILAITHVNISVFYYRIGWTIFAGIQCPVCKKIVQPEDAQCHLVMCLTKPQVIYNGMCAAWTLLVFCQDVHLCTDLKWMFLCASRDGDIEQLIWYCRWQSYKYRVKYLICVTDAVYLEYRESVLGHYCHGQGPLQCVCVICW